MIGGTYPAQSMHAPPRQEVYQVLTAQYDQSIIEHGPYINGNRTVPQHVMKPAYIRPSGPFKRVAAELPPPIYHMRRNYETLNHNYVIGENMVPVRGTSNGSTASSFSSSVDSDTDMRDESK